MKTQIESFQQLTNGAEWVTETNRHKDDLCDRSDGLVVPEFELIQTQTLADSRFRPHARRGLSTPMKTSEGAERSPRHFELELRARRRSRDGGLSTPLQVCRLRRKRPHCRLVASFRRSAGPLQGPGQ